MRIEQKVGSTETLTEATELDNIYKRLSDQNNRLINNLTELDKVGNKIKNTNFPRAAKDGQEKEIEPDGTLDHIGKQLDYFTSHNNFLEETVAKLSKLL